MQVLVIDILRIYAWDSRNGSCLTGNELKSKKVTKREVPNPEIDDGTLTDRAYRELEEMIVTLQLTPGTILSEHTLALKLKIGRTPIREALQRLARDGLS